MDKSNFQSVLLKRGLGKGFLNKHYENINPWSRQNGLFLY